MKAGIKYLWYRLITVRKEIKIIFFLSLSSILIIEVLLNGSQAKYHQLYSIEQIYLKICYSLTATIVFFFINQHLPKEERKMKSLVFVNNKAAKIQREIDYFLFALGVETKNHEKPALVLITDACDKISNMKLPVHVSTQESQSPFNNWYEYFDFKITRIKSLVKEILTFHELLDSGILEKLLKIDDNLSSNFLRSATPPVGDSMSFMYATHIYQLNKDSEEISKILKTKYKNYFEEYHRLFQQRVFRRNS